MISTIIIIGIILIATIAFNMQSRHEIKHRRQKENLLYTRRPEEEENSEDRVIIEPVSTSDADKEIMRTIELIGHKAYEEMTDRINKIMHRHGSQNSATVSLTCGPDTLDGAHELHRLLPGQPLKLVNCRAEGVDTIDVYFNGVRIGRLALDEADTILSIMRDNSITAAYVAEQNCFGRIGSHQMDIIVFYEPRKRIHRIADVLAPALNSVKKSYVTTKNICMN